MNTTQNTTESTANNVATLPAPTAPKTSREVIQANVDLLIQQLEAGHSEGLTAYLTAMGRFHNYSFGNILEIARQRPDATRVAGLYAWNQLGRKVIKGQKGIPAAASRASIRVFTPAGTVTVRIRLPFPSISGSTYRPSRCCRSSMLMRSSSASQTAAEQKGQDRPVSKAGERLRPGRPSPAPRKANHYRHIAAKDLRHITARATPMRDTLIQQGQNKARGNTLLAASC